MLLYRSEDGEICFYAGPLEVTVFLGSVELFRRGRWSARLFVDLGEWRVERGFWPALGPSWGMLPLLRQWQVGPVLLVKELW